VPAIALACMVTTPAWAAPGDPLGGDDTGCAPTTKQGLSCATKVHTLLAKLKRNALICHLTQDGQAFKTGMSSNGFHNAEVNCELGPSGQSAKEKFDALMGKLALVCDATVVANTNARRDVILGDASTAGSLDSLNAAVFCDATSGLEIDPGLNVGFIPSTTDHYKCSAVVAKLLSKLDYAVVKCHQKLVKAIFAGKPFDEEACEDTGIKSALAKYDAKVASYVGAGICPACLTDPMSPTNATTLGLNTVADADAQLQESYICPGP
jgi:hypothetical protein